jgi:molecular chaperone IbpA
MRGIDFAPLSRSSIGFDRLFDILEEAACADRETGYPPCDIKKIGNGILSIDLDVRSHGNGAAQSRNRHPSKPPT